MKTYLLLGIMVGTAYFCEAQSISSQQTVVPSPTPYAIAAQDANSRVWERTVYELDPSGKVVPRQEQYHELASGLNHLVNGQYMASSEEINILLNGTAVATNGQHQASFPGDIYQGEIQLLTPDGQLLQSRPLALAYFDGTNTVVIAELTNSVGLVGNNQVTYPNAFTGFRVDLRYEYTKAGFSQDIILRQQPPTPESLGLNGDTARLQIMTEFFSAPQPTITSTALPPQAGVSLDDESLDFGTMQMVPGRAFLMGQNAQDVGAMVSKHWLIVSGRQVLIEEVPVDAILERLAALPLTAMNSNSNKNIHTATKHFQLPPQRLAAKNTAKAMMLTKADLPATGFVLDYQTVTGTFTNYTFQGDSTFYISGPVNLYGTNTFEGGAVIKYTNNASLNLFSPQVNCLASAYRPVIFTARDDNSVGETISGSSGAPVGYYANPAINFSEYLSANLSNVRFAYASAGIKLYAVFSSFPIISNAQFVNCYYGIFLNDSGIHVRNTLFSHVLLPIYINMNYAVDLQNCTIDTSTYLAGGGTATINLTNNIMANITNSPFGGTTATGSANGFYKSPAFGAGQVTNTFYPFQSAGAGNYYLTNGVSFFKAGTSNIDATLLASLKQKTTYPPILYSNVTVSVNTTLFPQAQRDTDIPDLGYHYDPIDYLVDQYTITNASLTFTNGVAIASYNDSGIILSDGSTVVSIGSALCPNWFARYSSVQEQPVALGSSTASSALDFNAYHLTAAAAAGRFRFSKFACPAGGGTHLYDGQPGSPSFIYSTLSVEDCEFWSGNNTFSGGTNTVIALKNNLFSRSMVSAGPTATYTNNSLALSNNLFWNTSVTLTPSVNSNSNLWFVFNNSFDTCTITTAAHGNQQFTMNGYNAYILCNQQLSPANANDKVLTNSFAYQPGPLGSFYQPTNSTLIDMGSTNANLLGLYNFTTQTNQMEETNSVVDIGYHYMALDAHGYILDNDSDGVPDWEDGNPNDPNVGILNVFIDSPTNGAVIQ